MKQKTTIGFLHLLSRLCIISVKTYLLFKSLQLGLKKEVELAYYLEILPVSSFIPFLDVLKLFVLAYKMLIAILLTYATVLYLKKGIFKILPSYWIKVKQPSILKFLYILGWTIPFIIGWIFKTPNTPLSLKYLQKSQKTMYILIYLLLFLTLVSLNHSIVNRRELSTSVNLLYFKTASHLFLVVFSTLILLCAFLGTFTWFFLTWWNSNITLMNHNIRSNDVDLITRDGQEWVKLEKKIETLKQKQISQQKIIKFNSEIERKEQELREVYGDKSHTVPSLNREVARSVVLVVYHSEDPCGEFKCLDDLVPELGFERGPFILKAGELVPTNFSMGFDLGSKFTSLGPSWFGIKGFNTPETFGSEFVLVTYYGTSYHVEVNKTMIAQMLEKYHTYLEKKVNSLSESQVNDVCNALLKLKDEKVLDFKSALNGTQDQKKKAIIKILENYVKNYFHNLTSRLDDIASKLLQYYQGYKKIYEKLIS